MKITVYIAVSVDGFIARSDGRLDWLPGAGDDIVSENSPGDEDFGYGELMNSVDALVMGRNTFEKVLEFEEWAYGETPVYVMSRSLKFLPETIPASVKLVNTGPFELYNILKDSGIRHVYVDGGKTITSFLNESLVDELILTRIPVLIGEGIPLFGSLIHDIHLELKNTTTYSNGFVQSRYRIRSYG